MFMKTKKSLALILSAVLLASSVTSCSETKTNTGEEAGQNEAVTPVQEITEEVVEEEEQFMKDSLPEMDFGGEDAQIFCWESWDPGEFFVEEDTGEIVASAVFYRNTTVEDRLNVNLLWDQHSRSNLGSELKTAVNAQNQSGDCSYDAVAAYGMRVASCATDGSLMNLYDTTYVDLSKPWYYESAVIAGTLAKRHCYFCTGDITFNALARMSGIFFNNDMIINFNLEDPYELVLEGTWTIDKMHEMIKGTYVDLDGNGKPSDRDQYGLMCAGDQVNTLYYGTGLHFIDHDADMNPVISEDVLSEKTLTVLEKYLSVFDEVDAYKNPNTDVMTNFDEGRIMFYVYPLGHVSDGGLREAEMVYGFIPQPKVAEDEEYHASVTNAITLFAIPLVVASEERSSALIECLSSEGYRQVTPVVFEQAYKVKYNNDDSARQTKIFDMMRANAVFDMGKIFCDDLFAGFSNGVIGSYIWNGNSAYASAVAKMQKVWDKTMGKLQSKLDLDE